MSKKERNRRRRERRLAKKTAPVRKHARAAKAVNVLALLKALLSVEPPVVAKALCSGQIGEFLGYVQAFGLYQWTEAVRKAVHAEIEQHSKQVQAALQLTAPAMPAVAPVAPVAKPKK